MSLKKPYLLTKFLSYIKINKYNLSFASAIAIIIFMIIAMIAFVNRQADNKKTTRRSNSQITKAAYQTPSVTSTSSSIGMTTPEPTEATTIENETQPQITPLVAVSYTVSSIVKFGDTWGIMRITNSTVGGAAVIIKKENGVWKVIAGPGSVFPTDQLQSLGAPQELINSINNNQQK